MFMVRPSEIKVSISSGVIFIKSRCLTPLPNGVGLSAAVESA